MNWPDVELVLMAILISTGLAVCVAIMICCHCFWKTPRRLPPATALDTDSEAVRETEVVSPVLWRSPDPKEAQHYDTIQTISEAVSNRSSRRSSSQSVTIAETQTTSEDFHQCPVCMEQFSFDDRMPKILNCQHTLCQPCVEALVQTDTDGAFATLVCPECRSTQRTPWQGLAHVPNNLTMLRYMEYCGRIGRCDEKSTTCVVHLTCESRL